MSKYELARKALHISVGFFALLLKYLNWWQALLCCLGGFLSNKYLLPRITARGLEREDEKNVGYPLGIYAYPLTLGALCILFPARLDVVAVAWAMMAFGDGFATVFGKLIGGTSLQWNQSKRWSGLLGFIIGGTIFSFFIHSFVSGRNFSYSYPPQAGWMAGFLAIFAVSVLCAIFESLPSGLDDNIVVPFVAALSFYSLDETGPISNFKIFFSPQMAYGFMIVGVIAFSAYLFKIVRLSGMLGGWLVGLLVYGTTGLRGFLILIGFFAIATGATFLGLAKKNALGISQSEGGRRGAIHAFANCGVGVWLSLCIISAEASGLDAMLWQVAFVASFATALFDTVSTEIGKLFGETAIHLTSLKSVPRGTRGGVSAEGTFAGALCAAALALLGFAIGFLTPEGVAAVFAGAFMGALIESILNERLRADSEFMNFANTAMGAYIAGLVYYLMQ